MTHKKSIYIFLIKLLCLVLCRSTAYGQDTLSTVQKDTLKPQQKRVPLQLSALRIGLDIAPIAQNLYTPSQEKYEGNAEISLNNRYMLGISAGGAQYKQDGSTYRYRSRGAYFRLGIDYNFWYKDKNQAGGFATLGLHYGFGAFSHRLRAFSTPNYWQGGFDAISLEENNLNAHWLIIQGRLQGRVFKRWVIGPLARLQFLLTSSETSQIDINTIPGFGLRRGARIELGYHLLYEFPLKNK